MNHNERDLFARDGHLTMLSIDRYDVGELAAPARQVVETHIEGCATCRARLHSIAQPRVVLLPRPAMGRSAGSVTIGYLAASAGVAAAASVALGLGSLLWPDPQTARPVPGEPLHVSGSYTSVAQEIGEPDAPALRVSTRAHEVFVSGIDGAHLAVLAVSSSEQDGGTGGEDEPIVIEVVASMPTAGDSARVSIPARMREHRFVVAACPVPLQLVVGDALALDPGCTAVDVSIASEPED